MQADYALRFSDQELALTLSGSWTLEYLTRIERRLEEESASDPSHIVIDGKELTQLDTAGVMLLYHRLRDWGLDDSNLDQFLELKNFSEEQLQLARLVREKLGAPAEIGPSPYFPFLERIGRSFFQICQKVLELFSFVGESFLLLARLVFRPDRIRRKELISQLEQVFVDAIFVNALVTFLIGVVVAYLFAMQIQKYGANIFIVDAVALAMCRELSPIIVAIIVAGRSGSAFTAQIGSMKINEELDAMRTIGLSVMEVLVMPRVLALMIAMPLLVFLGDMVGILGGMLIAELRLDITGVTYLERLQSVLKLKHVFVGLVKAPVFAAFIAIIGCRMGLSVKRDARSLGSNTTSTVVQSIVSVILLNAAFAIMFAELKI